MTDFYLTLPSNASLDHYPNNAADHYYTDLPEEINLSGRRYEIGLSEIQFPKVNISQLYDGWIEFKSNRNEKSTRYTIQPGPFNDEVNLIHNLNKTLLPIHTNQPKKDWCYFNYNRMTRKVKVHIPVLGSELKLSNEIASILGLNKVITGPGIYEGFSTVNVHRNINVYIYCDLVEFRQVGDMKVPLLRIVPTLDKKKDIVYMYFGKPHYIPFGRNVFNTVEIALKTGTGTKPAFITGDTVVTLHCRPKRL